MKTFPRWVSWVFVVFLGYIVLTGNFRDPAPSKIVGKKPAATPTEYTALKQATDGERWKKAIYPDYQAADEACRAPAATEGLLPAYATIEKEGRSDSAALACGDRADLLVAAYNPQGKLAPAKQMDLNLGEQPEFDALVVGMRLDEERVIVLVPQQRYANLPMLLPNRLQVLRVTSHGTAQD